MHTFLHPSQADARRKTPKTKKTGTVAPGIYIPEERIGIRIEDVVLVTKDEPQVLSGNIPRTIKDIERTMAK